ncbi:unnamed protein product [Discula destructiva]
MSANDYYHQGPPQQGGYPPQGGYPQQGYGQQGPPQYPQQVSILIPCSRAFRDSLSAMLTTPPYSPTALLSKADTTSSLHRCSTSNSHPRRAQEAAVVA